MPRHVHGRFCPRPSVPSLVLLWLAATRAICSEDCNTTRSRQSHIVLLQTGVQVTPGSQEDKRIVFSATGSEEVPQTSDGARSGIDEALEVLSAEDVQQVLRTLLTDDKKKLLTDLLANSKKVVSVVATPDTEKALEALTLEDVQRAWSAQSADYKKKLLSSLLVGDRNAETPIRSPHRTSFAPQQILAFGMTDAPNYTAYMNIAEGIKNRLILKAMMAVLRTPPEGPFDVANMIHQCMGFDQPPSAKWIYLIILCVYIVLCLAVEICESRKEFAETAGAPQGSRNDVWDLAKLILVFFVVACHVVVFVFQQFDFPRWTLLWWGMPFTVCGLVFITGVFSQTFSIKSLAMTLVGIPCTLFLFDATVSVMSLITPGLTLFQIGRSGVEWYLECMFVWRLTIPFFFSAMKRIGIPGVVSWLGVFIASYAIWCGNPFPDDPLGPIAPLRPLFPWRSLVFNAPYFALGLLKTPDEWTELFCRQTTVIVSLCILAVYYIGVEKSLAFRQFYDSACGEPGQCEGVWWPDSVEVSGYSSQTFEAYTNVFLQKSILCFTMVPFCVAVVPIMKKIFPRFTQVLLSFGSRTFYAYLLHWTLVIMPACRTGLNTEAAKLAENPHLYRVPVAIFTICLYLALCSRLTERIFGFLMKTPIWIAEAAGLMKKSNGPAENALLNGKASETVLETQRSPVKS